MKTIVCQEPFMWKITEREKPKCQQGEALVRVRRIGICGTDIHAFGGNQPYFTYPRVLGHELSGTVEEVKKINNSDIKVGDQVAVIALFGVWRLSSMPLWKDKLLFYIKGSWCSSRWWHG